MGLINVFRLGQNCARLGLLTLCLIAAGSHEAMARVPKAQAIAAPLRQLLPYRSFYGVYVGGSKVGFMEARLDTHKELTLSYHLEAQVRGMGRTTPVVVEEVRSYDRKTLLLRTLTFRQTADSGSMTVTAHRVGKNLVCTTQAGGVDHTVTVVANETLDDALGQYILVTRPGAKPSDGVTVAHFDAQAQAMTEVQLRIDAMREVMVSGIASKMFEVETHYPAMGVKEKSTVDATGKLMTTHMGGFFEARLEPEEVAKKLDLPQDVLVQAVVKAPVKLEGVDKLHTLSLSMRGFDDAPPPASMRQQVQSLPSDKSTAKDATLWQLTLHKDAPLPELPYPISGANLAKVKQNKEVHEALLPTPFIQSTAKPIREAAKQAIGRASTVADAVQNLVDFVQNHLRAEYVPAFSNALEALQSGRGDCTEYSVLFVALARACGIPARVAVGVAYWPPGDGFGWHAWAEIYADDRWISVDPTWGQTISDVTHLKFAEGGPSQQARLVMLMGRLHIDAMQAS